MKTPIRWMVVLLVAVAGLSIFGSGTGYCDPGGGSFDVPKVQEHFEQFPTANRNTCYPNCAG
ncbi:hypothetical protein [Thermoactinomyces mirandus]|uniref:Uncharacterized protein n=1 Tax=Thermoactinomyces mirandus TaxID=2756294 RepID=A0A7W1XSA1_9BACL|nr:hypothetical protein [Thermoactinomyces mirandus]MBA4602140.1 hypothetical protein [Thermoactinomyces mirandus]